jgi:hypothetical protein
MHSHKTFISFCCRMCSSKHSMTVVYAETNKSMTQEWVNVYIKKILLTLRSPHKWHERVKKNNNEKLKLTSSATKLVKRDFFHFFASSTQKWAVSNFLKIQQNKIMKICNIKRKRLFIFNYYCSIEFFIFLLLLKRSQLYFRCFEFTHFCSSLSIYSIENKSIANTHKHNEVLK